MVHPRILGASNAEAACVSFSLTFEVEIYYFVNWSPSRWHSSFLNNRMCHLIPSFSGCAGVSPAWVQDPRRASKDLHYILLAGAFDDVDRPDSSSCSEQCQPRRVERKGLREQSGPPPVPCLAAGFMAERRKKGSPDYQQRAVMDRGPGCKF